jgi:hypothetical protein
VKESKRYMHLYSAASKLIGYSGETYFQRFEWHAVFLDDVWSSPATVEEGIHTVRKLPPHHTRGSTIPTT